MRTSIFFLVVFGVAAIFASSAQVTEGVKLYADKCASCHATDGSGTTTRGKAMKVPDLRAPGIQKKTDDQLLDAIGRTNAHRGFRKSIGDDKLRMTIMHMRTLKSKG